MNHCDQYSDHRYPQFPVIDVLTEMVSEWYKPPQKLERKEGKEHALPLPIRWSFHYHFMWILLFCNSLIFCIQMSRNRFYRQVHAEFIKQVMLCVAEPVFNTGSPRPCMRNNILHVGFETKVHLLHPWTPRLHLSSKSWKITAKKTPDIFCYGTRTIQGNAMK